MNPSCCEKEQEILDAVRSGRWPDGGDDALRSHAADCPVCADVALAAQFLQREGESAKAEAALPHSGLIWWKAELLAKRAAAERATQPITIVQRVACACGGLSLLGIMNWQWPLILGWLKRFRDPWAHRSLLAAWNHPSNFNLFLSLCASLLLMAFVFGIFWAKE